MRTYLILKEKAEQFNADKEVRQILREVNREDSAMSKLTGRYSSENATKLKAAKLDPVALAKKPLPYERLDQILIDVLLGVR
jgi:xylose isomerase